MASAAFPSLLQQLPYRVMLGTTDHEHSFVSLAGEDTIFARVDDDQVRAQLAGYLRPLGVPDPTATANAIVDAYCEGRLVRRLKGRHPLFDAVLGDYVFSAAVEVTADTLVGAGAQDTFVYRVDYQDGWIGPAHTSDLPLWFGTSKLWAPLCGFGRDTEAASREMVGALQRFVSGLPPLPQWPRWSLGTRPVMIFGDDAGGGGDEEDAAAAKRGSSSFSAHPQHHHVEYHRFVEPEMARGGHRRPPRRSVVRSEAGDAHERRVWRPLMRHIIGWYGRMHDEAAAEATAATAP